MVATPNGLRPLLAVPRGNVSLFTILDAGGANPLGLRPIAIQRAKVAGYGTLGSVMQSRWD